MAGNATSDDQPPTWEQFQADKLAEHRLVAVTPDGRVLGWVCLTGVRALRLLRSG